MFSKSEFRKFLAQMREIENKVATLFHTLAKDVEDKDIRKTFEALHKSELHHISILNDLDLQ